MKVRHVETVEKVTFTYHCDFCRARATTKAHCDVCGKDVCDDCAKQLEETSWHFYPSLICPACANLAAIYLPAWIEGQRHLAELENKTFLLWKAASLGIDPERMSLRRLDSLAALVNEGDPTDKEQEEYHNLQCDYHKHPLPE